MEHDAFKSAFYVTVGRGTESFAIKEIKRKLSARILSSSDEGIREGKIFFCIKEDTSVALEKMLKLKSVERIFVAISDYSNKCFHGKRLFLDKLIGEMSCEQSYSFAQLVLKQLASLGHGSDLSTSKTVPQLELELNDQSSDEQPQAKRAKPENTNEDFTIDLKNPCTNNCPSMIYHNSGGLSEGSFGFQNTMEYSFRLSIKCSGKIRKWLQIKKLSRDLAWRVAKASGWTVNLRNPLYEICVHISDQYVTAGIPLTRMPLSRRKFVFDPGLRGPVAWIMTDLADITDGDIVLDPMCGKGTLLLEACCESENVTYIGVDNDSEQLSSAVKNCKVAGFGKEMIFSFMQADTLNLPLKNSSVSAVVCDAPFNKKYFTTLDAGDFYICFLCEMNRILQKNGNLVLLTSQELSEKITADLHNFEHGSDGNRDSPCNIKCQRDKKDCMYNLGGTDSLKLESKHNVKLGETLATILFFRKKDSQQIL